MKRNKSKKVLFTAIILALFGVLFYFWGVNIRGVALPFFSPLFRLQRYVFGREEGENVETKNERIHKEEQKKLDEEIGLLRKFLLMKEKIKTRAHTADVLYYGSEFGKEFLILGQGEDVGITTGDMAIDHNNMVVGMVREVGQNFSKVSLASNEGEVFEVEFLPIHERGIARGMGGRMLNIELIPANYIIKKGDFIVLSYGRSERFYISEIVREDPNGGAALKVARSMFLANPENLHNVFIIDLKSLREQ